MNVPIAGLLFVLLLSLIGVAGDFCIKQAGHHVSGFDLRWFLGGIGMYVVTAIGWFFAMRHMKLATLGVFYSVSTILLLTLLSVLYYQETLNKSEIAGVLTALTSVFLLIRVA